MLTGPVMYACTKAIEIAFESIPESIIQANGLLSALEGGIKDFQIASVGSSIAAAAFIIMEANFGFIQSKSLESPGNPYYGWIPTKPRKKIKCQAGNSK